MTEEARKPKLSIVIPALNERESLAPTLDAVARGLTAAGAENAEIIVVDDGSSDGTGELATSLGARVVRHVQNLGYGRSLKDGIRAASGEWVVITDSDGTYPVEEALPSLLRAAEAGFEMVVGARQGQHYRQSFGKSVLRSILRLLVEFTTGRSIPDVNSGLRIFHRETILPYLPHLSNAFSFTTSLTLAFLMTGRTVLYQPIDYRERIGRSKVRLVRDSLRTLQFIVEAMTFYNPSKMFLLLALVAVASLVPSLAVAALTSVPLGLLVAICLVGAVVVFSLGLTCSLLRQLLSQR